MKEKYTLDKSTLDMVDKWVAMFLLDYINKEGGSISVLLEDANSFLEKPLDKLYSKDLLVVTDESYVLADKGREALKKFMRRFDEINNMLYVYQAVDLGEGTFAFSEFYNCDDDDEWEEYLNLDENWEDLRLTVLEYKNKALEKKGEKVIDPREVVFMNFIDAGRFDTDVEGWQLDLLSTSLWDNIIEICNSSLQSEDLGKEDVIQDIIKQGTDLMFDLMNQKKESEEDGDEVEDEEKYGDDVQEIICIETQPISYWESYYDPFYVAPVFYDPYHDPYYW